MVRSALVRDGHHVSHGRRTQDKGYQIRQGKVGMFGALVKPKALLGEKDLSRDPAAEVYLEKAESGNAGEDMERHGEHTR